MDTLDLTNWPPGTAGADDVSMTLRYADSFRAFERVPGERATLLDAAIVRAKSPETLAHVHTARGDLRRFRADLDGAEADYARALELFTAVQDNLGLAQVLEARGDLYAGTGVLDRAEGFYLDALPLYERAREALGMSNVLAELAQTRARLGDRAGARAYAQRAEPLARTSHNRYAMNVIARVLAWAGDVREE